MKRFLGKIPRRVRIVEVGPRDGLQNEARYVSLADKIRLIDILRRSGLQSIEVGSFVSPKWVPQMKDTEDIFRHYNSASTSSLSFSALTPNMKGLESALALKVPEVAVFGAASEKFSKKNINCSVDESIDRFTAVCEEALKHGIKVRGYVSCVLGCPYEGAIDPNKVVHVTKRLLDLGCYEVSLGDTIGVGTPGSTAALLDTVLGAGIPAERLAVHFHDTYGQALANILTALQYGVSVVDSSVSGLGGCPYAAGASGNVATEDVVYMLSGMGVETGVDIDVLTEAAAHIDSVLGSRRSGAKYTQVKLGGSGSQQQRGDRSAAVNTEKVAKFETGTDYSVMRFQHSNAASLRHAVKM